MPYCTKSLFSLLLPSVRAKTCSEVGLYELDGEKRFNENIEGFGTDFYVIQSHN